MKHEIICLLIIGESHASIAKQLGCAKSTVSYHAKLLGLSKGQKKTHDWRSIARYQAEGHTRLECMKQFDISPTAWALAVKANKVERQPYARPKGKAQRSYPRDLKKKLIHAGILEVRCYGENCTVATTWLGKPLSLHLDHIDGNPSNNEHYNLRLLCPNCHSQTDTYTYRNIKKSRNRFVEMRPEDNLASEPMAEAIKAGN